jgi:hypothetical protein
VSARAGFSVGVGVAILACAGRARAEGTPPPAPQETGLSLSARAGLQYLYLEGDGAPPDLKGYGFAAEAAMHVWGALSVGASFEPSIYNTRSDRVPTGATATSYATFAFVRLDTNREGPLSVAIQIASGYRWLIVPVDGSPADRFSGIEPLLIRLGPTYRVHGGVDLGLLAGLGVGWFQDVPNAKSCAVVATCGDSLFDSDTQSAAHFTVDLSLVVRGLL